MTGLGTRLGLTPPRSLGPIPVLMRIDAVDKWPANALYIGKGNLRHAQAAGAWSSPFKPGPDGSYDACARRCAEKLATYPESRLLQRGHSLWSKVLVCDCAQGQPCHGESLVALAVQAHQHSQQQHDQQQQSKAPAPVAAAQPKRSKVVSGLSRVSLW